MEPLKQLFDAVEWKPTERKPSAADESGLPWATHGGILHFCGFDFKVVQLNTGQRLFVADSVEEFFSGIAE